MRLGVVAGEFVAWAHRRRRATIIIGAIVLICLLASLAVRLILGLMRSA